MPCVGRVPSAASSQGGTAVSSSKADGEALAATTAAAARGGGAAGGEEVEGLADGGHDAAEREPHQLVVQLRQQLEAVQQQLQQLQQQQQQQQQATAAKGAPYAASASTIPQRLFMASGISSDSSIPSDSSLLGGVAGAPSLPLVEPALHDRLLALASSLPDLLARLTPNLTIKSRWAWQGSLALRHTLVSHLNYFRSLRLVEQHDGPDLDLVTNRILTCRHVSRASYCSQCITYRLYHGAVALQVRAAPLDRVHHTGDALQARPASGLGARAFLQTRSQGVFESCCMVTSFNEPNRGRHPPGGFYNLNALVNCVGGAGAEPGSQPR